MSESAKDVMELANKARDIFEEEEYVNIIGERIAALIQSSFEAWARERLSPAMRDMGMEDCEISEVLQAVPSSRQSASGELLPCPRCEGVAEIVHGMSDGWVACSTCGATGRRASDDSEATAWWNKRIVSAPTDKKGDGSESRPFTGTFSGKGFKRHDSNLFIGICERDEGFEIIVTPETGNQRLYAIAPDGSCLEVGKPKPTDEKALKMAARVMAKKWLAYPTDSDFLEEESLTNCLVEFALSHESPKDETARNADGTPYGGVLDGVAHESPKEQV